MIFLFHTRAAHPLFSFRAAPPSKCNNSSLAHLHTLSFYFPQTILFMYFEIPIKKHGSIANSNPHPPVCKSNIRSATPKNQHNPPDTKQSMEIRRQGMTARSAMQLKAICTAIRIIINGITTTFFIMVFSSLFECSNLFVIVGFTSRTGQCSILLVNSLIPHTAGNRSSLWRCSIRSLSKAR